MAAVLEQAVGLSHKRVINHDIMHCTADGVAGNHLYSGRALGLSEPWDIIQLHPDLEPLWDDIRGHYRRIGLSHTQDVIWHVDRASLGEHIGYLPSVFYFGPNECVYWGDRQWLDTVEYINSKNNFMILAQQLGVDVPLTCCFQRAADIDAKVRASTAYPCYLKAAVSVSGVGIYRCENAAELAEAVAGFEPDTPVQIQEEVLSDVFLNLQYEVVGDELIRLQASQQILEGTAHQGNRVPADLEPWESVEPMARWLRDNGIKGVFAFDVAVVQGPEGVRFPAIECNPRFNGASYPTMIAHKLGIREWTATTFHTRHRDLASIDLRGLAFNAQTGEGAILVNWGTVLVGKVMILMAGSPAYREALQVELQAML
jgi:hypothetical protein